MNTLIKAICVTALASVTLPTLAHHADRYRQEADYRWQLSRVSYFDSKPVEWRVCHHRVKYRHHHHSHGFNLKRSHKHDVRCNEFGYRNIDKERGGLGSPSGHAPT